MAIFIAVVSLQLIVFPVHVPVCRLKKIQQKKKIIRDKAEMEKKKRLAALEAEGGGRGGRAGDEGSKNSSLYVMAVILDTFALALDAKTIFDAEEDDDILFK